MTKPGSPFLLDGEDCDCVDCGGDRTDIRCSELAPPKKERDKMSGTKYGIVYGFEGDSDYTIDGGYETAEAAKAAYDPDRRVRSINGVLSGAEIVRLGDSTINADGEDLGAAPEETIEILAEDEDP